MDIKFKTKCLSAVLSAGKCCTKHRALVHVGHLAVSDSKIDVM